MRQAVNLVLNLTGMLIILQIILDFLRDRRELRIDRAEDSYFLLLLTDNLLLLGLNGMIQLLSGRAQPAARAGLLLCLFVHDTVPCFMLRRYYRFAVCRLEKTERLAPLRECVFWLFPLLGVLFLIINLAYPLFYSAAITAGRSSCWPWPTWPASTLPSCTSARRITAAPRAIRAACCCFCPCSRGWPS